MYPKRIMNEVRWAFYGSKYSSIEEFIIAVNAYNKNLDVQLWNPKQIVLDSKEVSIQYAYWDEEEEDEIEENFVLAADSHSFTASELLFKIHNKVVEHLDNDDKHFFEGLSLWEGENIDNPSIPLYFLDLGS